MYSIATDKSIVDFTKTVLELLALFFYTICLFIPLTILRLKGYKLARIKSDRLGHLVSETYTIKNDADLKSYNIIFLLKKNGISNFAFIEMFKLKYSNIFLMLPNFVFRSIRLPKLFMINVDVYNTVSNEPMKSYSIYAKLPNSFSVSDLPNKSVEQYKKFLDYYEVSSDAKLVILHFRSNKSGYSDEDEHFMRNVDPITYVAMVEYLCKKDFVVVRIGDAGVDMRINQNKKYIDYANSKFKSGYLDLALIADCNFFIGGSTGAVYMAAVFGKPILGLNMCLPFNYSPSGKPNEIGLPKLVRSKVTKKILSLKDIFEYKVYKVRSSEDPLMKIYELVDNDAIDFVNAVKEIIFLLEKPDKFKSNYQELNNFFRDLDKDFEVDKGSLSKFSLSFFKTYRKKLLGEK
jgi:putative glycosyltransferase (TIGR04372 family)